MTSQRRPRIGIVIGSTRDGRFGDKPAQWFHDIARQRDDMVVEQVDLRDHPLPFFNEAASLSQVSAANAAARHWAAVLEDLDGFIVVTPEYNRGPSAVLKNAFDHAWHEFARKPIGFVGYGAVGAARAIEQLRLTAIELQMVPVRPAVHLGMVEFLGISQQGRGFEDFPHLAQAATTLLNHIGWWSELLCARRRPEEEHVPG
jgi:NAD(P)H-dependent FMN reductase